MKFVPVYDANKTKIYHGDNIDFTTAMDAESVDLTVTSPPYDSLRTYTRDEDWTHDKFKLLAAQLYRVTRPGGVVVWNVADQAPGGSETGSSFRQALFMMDCGFLLADTMIYRKANPGGARGSYRTYIQCFEYMFVFSKGQIKTHNLICDRPNKKPGKQKGGGARLPNSGVREGRTYESTELGRRFNIWEYPTQGNEFSVKHPAPFPTQMAEDHIVSWSNPGDVVFDPFMGSGTTAVAAGKHKRQSIGVEISREYVDLSVERLDAFYAPGVEFGFPPIG